MEINIFDNCKKINDFLTSKNEVEARNELIRLLDYHSENDIQYTPLVNHLIRATGLYPYINVKTSDWQEKFIFEAFKVDIGGKLATLHKNQSLLLKMLINGDNIAVSAPTSFGKSFIIDAFISIKQPKNVVIIVPTIALTDETRRRIYKKFSDRYKIITTTDVSLGEQNILIFPQERAINYVDKIDNIDLLIIDEFYKASAKFDKDRSSTLLRAILKLGKKAKQRYYLAPNITKIIDNVFTNGMTFIEMLDFNTVFLEKHELYKEWSKIKGEQFETLKSNALLKILKEKSTKSLIYAGQYSNIEKVSNLLIANIEPTKKVRLNQFADWLAKNYAANWSLNNLVRRGSGIHNGKLHRSLSQIQIKLFEEKNGFDNIISTSSIIEGVNTSAENVIVWRNKNGIYNLNDFTYKNIIGRGGRMFKHFVGKIYILEPPPENEETQLDIAFPDAILGDIDEVKYKDSLTNSQIEKIISFKQEMYDILGKDSYDRLLKENVFQLSNSTFIKEIAIRMKKNPDEWNGLAYLNSDDISNWDRLLYKIIGLQPGIWEIEWNKFVGFIKVLSKNWTKSIPQLLEELEHYDINIDSFFKLERNVSFKLSALLSDVNVLQKEILNNKIDLSHFISKLSHVFLPSVVYQLEEYGLPRMISRKLHLNKVINFEKEQTIHDVIDSFNKIDKNKLITKPYLDEFDKYILEYFYEGITMEKNNQSQQS